MKLTLKTLQWIPVLGIPALIYGGYHPEIVDNLFHANDWEHANSLILAAAIQGFSTAVFLYYIISPILK